MFEPIPVPPSGNGPAVLLLHEGHFASGWIYSGLLDNPVEDLRNAGYYVFVAGYRLAPCGGIKGQECHDDTAEGKASGRPPQQTDDVKAFIRAIRADSRCDNGRVGVVGGSSGASHAAFVVFDTSSTSVWPNWNQNGDDRPLAAACLSGAYDFTDRTTDSYYDSCGGDPVNEFRNKIENYTGTCVLFDPNGGPNQWASSPVALLHQGVFTNKLFRPMYFIHSRCDSMPYHQLAAVQCKLGEVGVDSSQYQLLTVPGSEHAFQYWRTRGVSGSPVTTGALVISFLNTYLQ